MKHNINKMAAIFIASIFALSGLGVAYAGWTDTLTITGDVTTGDVNWVVNLPITMSDTFAPPPIYPTPTPDLNCDPNLGFNGMGSQPFYVEKNVGWGESTLIDDHTISMIIYNAYPGYYNHIDFWVHYIGSIPGKIDSFVIRNEAGIVLETIRDLGIYEFDISGDGINDMQIKWGHPFGDQLHYCNERDVSFGFCFLQPLPQDSVITLYLEYVVVQWNEYPLP